MAFTLSHCIVAVPLSKIFLKWIPIAAIAIGSMTPDLYRLFSSSSGKISHQWTGLIYPNMFIGVLFCLLWYFIYKPTLFYFVTSKNNKNDLFLKLNLFQKSVSIICGLILGCITHLIWDGFTHLDYRTLFFHDTLAQYITIGNKTFPLYTILQISSSILALPLLFWMIYTYIKNELIFKKVTKNDLIFSCFIILGSLLLGCLSAYIYIENITTSPWSNHRYYFLGRIANKFLIGFLIASSILCILFQIIKFKR